MSDERRRCQFSYHTLHAASLPITAFTIKLYLYSLRKHIQETQNPFALIEITLQHLRTRIFSPVLKYFQRKSAHPPQRRRSKQVVKLGLLPGELVEVLSEEQIRSTLDARGRMKGLEFMTEMRKYCGKRFKVFKRLEKITLETTGEMRKIQDTVLLEGVICDGSAHFGCDRSCFCFWRESWLRRVPSEAS